jgi:Alpha/beta hydrolase of unknown function (DUF915).
MKTFILFAICLLQLTFSNAQKIETVYLNPKDSSSEMYIALIPEKIPVRAFMFLLDGFGASPQDVLIQTDLPKYAAQQGILTILPILKTGPLYFGSGDDSQKSLKHLIELIASKYHVTSKNFFIGGFSMGGNASVKYAEMAVQNNYPIKPKAVFGVDPPLDWEKFFNSAKRIVRLSDPANVNQEAKYMIDRLQKELKGSPQSAIQNYYNNSPYSFSDNKQRAVKTLIHIPIMLISEPDIDWWMKERGFDYSYINITDHAAMINELQRLGNKKAVLVTTTNKGYREPGHVRHPHSWSIADKVMVVNWLLSNS